MTTRTRRLVVGICVLGAIVDAVAALALASPPDSLLRRIAYPGVASGQVDFAEGTRTAAPLMLGWTVLLVWAAARPVERRAVLAATALVVAGFVVVELSDVGLGNAALGLMLPTLALQLVLATWFVVAWALARRAGVRPAPEPEARP